MKTKSKILVLLLTLAMLCGILALSVFAADENPVGVVDYLSMQSGDPSKAGKSFTNAPTWYTHISDTGNAYMRHFYSKEAAKNQNQYSYNAYINNYFTTGDKYLTMEFDFSTETHFDTSETTSILFLGRPGPADAIKVNFGYDAEKGNYVRLGNGEKIQLENLQPYEWHHITLILEPKNVTISSENKVTADKESRAVLYLDGKKVAEQVGSIFPNGITNIEAIRIQTIQSDVNRETGDLCIDNLISKRVTSAYEGDLSAVMDGTGSLGNYAGIFTWNDSYVFPTGKRAMAVLNGVNYTDAQAAIDAASEGETVVLYEDILPTHALTINKNICVQATGLEFNYRAPGYMVAKSGDVYTFTKVDHPAKVTVTFGDEVLESADFIAGESPAILGATTVRMANRNLYLVSSWKMTVDGAEVEFTDTVTEEMHGKEVVYTADSFTRVAMVYTDANGVDHYIPYTDDASAATAFLEFFNNSTTQEYKFTKNDKLTLECDIVTAKGITNSWKFGTNDQANCVLDLNGHDFRFTGSGTVFPDFRISGKFYLISSVPGARVISDRGNGTILFSMWGGAYVYVGGYQGADGDNISFYDFTVGSVGSTDFRCNGGHYYLTKGGNLLENVGYSAIAMENAKIYLGKQKSCVLYMNQPENNTASDTFKGTQIYSIGADNVFVQFSAKANAKANLKLTDTRIFGMKSMVAAGVNVTADEKCEFCVADLLPSLEDGYVYAHPVSPERSYDGFVDLDGNKLPASGVAYVKALATETAEVRWTIDGTTVLSDRWMIGSTPYYVGTVTNIPLREDPDNKNCILTPGDNWLIDGTAISEITAEQASAGTALVATPEFVSTPKAFEVTVDGVTTYYIDTDYETLCNFVSTMSAAAKIKIYTDYVVPQSKGLVFTKAGTELDLNGHTIRTDYKFGVGFIEARAEIYVYSSAPGAQLLADHAFKDPYGGGFILGATDGTVTLGRTKDGATYDRGNLTVKGSCLISLYQNAVIDSITYINTVGDNYGLIQFWKNDLSVEIKNSDIFLTLNNKALIAARVDNATGGWTVTVSGSRIYTGARSLVNYINGSKGKNPPGMTITDSVLCTPEPLANDENFPIHLGAGVRMNHPSALLLNDGIVLAKIDAQDITLGGNQYTLLYEAVTEEDAVTATFMRGTAELAKETWKKGSTPTSRREDAFGTYYWDITVSAPITADTVYTAKLKTTESKISGNLTLYADITFNLYFKADGFIKGVTYNGTTVTFTDGDLTEIGGVSYYRFTISDIAPKDLSKAFRLDVVLENEGAEETYSVMTSLVKYAASVFASEETDNVSEAGKTLVLSLLDYVRETSVALGGVALDSEGIRAIDACLAKYSYERKTWTKPEDVTLPSAGDITGASLRLVSDPGFIFYLDAAKYAQAGTVTVTVNGVTKSYTVKHATVDGEEKYYITVDNIHISNYRADLKVTLGEQTFIYNFDMYMVGFGEDVPSYANALYSYSLAAAAYLAAQVGTR